MKLFKYGLCISSALLLSYGVVAAAQPPQPIHEQGGDQYTMVPSPEGGHYFWKSAQSDHYLHYAVVGGQEGDLILFICQAFYHGGVHPGKVVAGRCNITYAGMEIPRNNFRVLVGEGLDWRTPKPGRIPRNAVQGGFENGQPLYICHAQYRFHGVHPGKVVDGACNIGYGGREIRLEQYQVLVNQLHS